MFVRVVSEPIHKADVGFAVPLSIELELVACQKQGSYHL